MTNPISGQINAPHPIIVPLPCVPKEISITSGIAGSAVAIKNIRGDLPFFLAIKAINTQRNIKTKNPVNDSMCNSLKRMGLNTLKEFSDETTRIRRRRRTDQIVETDF